MLNKAANCWKFICGTAGCQSIVPGRGKLHIVPIHQSKTVKQNQIPIHSIPLLSFIHSFISSCRMGGPIWAFLFPCCCFLIMVLAEKPDLLRFVLNVKQGIREPTSSSAPGKEQGRVVSSHGSGGLTGFNAFSIANVGQGQSKSANSQSSQTGKIGQESTKSKSSANDKQKQIGNAGLFATKPTTQNSQSADGNGHSKPPLQPTLNRTLPPSPSIPPSVQKPNAEDPYGLEIGGVVETTTTQAQTTKMTAPSMTTTTASTTTTTKMPPCGPDVLFVLDSTGSVRLVYNDQWNYILDVAKQMDIGPNDQHVGLILYSSKVKQRVVVGLDEPKSKEEFLQIVRELPYHGGITATGTALELTVKALAKRRQNKRTLVVVLTDGFTYDDWEIPSRNLQSFGSGVDVIVAGDVKNYARQILEKIAGDPARVLLGEKNKPKALDYLRCR